MLLVETMIVPSDEPILRFVDEAPYSDQGLTHRAIVPSSATLDKMLRAAGFAWVGEYADEVAHPDFRETGEHYRRRGLFLAARMPLDLPGFRTLPEVRAPMFDTPKPAGPADGEAEHLRGALERTRSALKDKESLISRLAAAADERLHLLDRATAEADALREALGRSTAELEAKERLIAELAVASEERLRLLGQVDAQAALLRDRIGVLVRQLQQKDQEIAALRSPSGSILGRLSGWRKRSTSRGE